MSCSGGLISNFVALSARLWCIIGVIAKGITLLFPNLLYCVPNPELACFCLGMLCLSPLVSTLFLSESWFTRLGALAPALVSLGEVLGDIQTIEEATLQSLENTFCAPMEDFVKREIKTIRKVSNDSV